MEGPHNIEASQKDEAFTVSTAMKEFKEIDKYRAILVGKKIKEIHFAIDADEGLLIKCEDGSGLYFAFAGEEGIILALADTKELISKLAEDSIEYL